MDHESTAVKPYCRRKECLAEAGMKDSDSTQPGMPWRART
jgi:hypothetical protein